MPNKIIYHINENSYELGCKDVLQKLITKNTDLLVLGCGSRWEYMLPKIKEFIVNKKEQILPYSSNLILSDETTVVLLKDYEELRCDFFEDLNRFILKNFSKHQIIIETYKSKYQYTTDFLERYKDFVIEKDEFLKGI